MKDKKQESNIYTSDTLPLNMATPNINELMKTSDANEDSMLSSSILKQDSMQESKFEVKESQPLAAIQVSEPASLFITTLAYWSNSSGWITSLPVNVSSSFLTSDSYKRVNSVFVCILTCSVNKRFASKSFDSILLQIFGVSSIQNSRVLFSLYKVKLIYLRNRAIGRNQNSDLGNPVLFLPINFWCIAPSGLSLPFANKVLSSFGTPPQITPFPSFAGEESVVAYKIKSFLFVLYKHHGSS